MYCDVLFSSTAIPHGATPSLRFTVLQILGFTVVRMIVLLWRTATWWPDRRAPVASAATLGVVDKSLTHRQWCKTALHISHVQYRTKQGRTGEKRGGEGTKHKPRARPPVAS